MDLIKKTFIIKKKLNKVYYLYLVKSQPIIHRKKLIELKKKGKIKVAFFALHAEVWKYDLLYRLLQNNPKFEPIIFVCPIINNGKENMIKEMEKTYRMFKVRNYNVKKTYNQEEGTYLDVRKEFSPDIIFYSNPYKGIIDDRYYITKYRDKLTCYVPYAFMNGNQKWAYDNLLINLCWKVFYPNEMYRNTAKDLSSIKGRNISVSGYPIADDFILRGENTTNDPWKIKDRKIKRLIWAPHHSILDSSIVDNSTFLDNYNIILKIAEKYKDKIQIAFKPHPLLLNNLYKHSDWGEKRANEYYDTWKNLPNGTFSEGDYIDLFLTSDAMIHDCGSFMIEYHYTKKPVMYISNHNVDYLSDFGRLAYNMHYKGSSPIEIETFINKVVLSGDDEMLFERRKFYQDHLLSPNNNSVSENIINEILRYI